VLEINERSANGSCRLFAGKLKVHVPIVVLSRE
jgi:hypothetical protein